MGRFARLSILVVMLLSLVSPVVRAAGEGPAPEEERAERRLLRLINDYRQAQVPPLPVLVRHNIITREARQHSNYMANHGELSHDNFDQRKAEIAASDSGIDENKICETTASAQGYDRPGPVAKKMFRAWRRTASTRRCLLDRDFSTQSGGVGVQHVGDTWYATFIAAHDTSP